MKFHEYLELFNQQMKLGKKVEKEHLKDPKLRNALKNQLNKIQGAVDTTKEKKAENAASKIIATPHLREIPKYYDLLIPMEKKAQAKLRAQKLRSAATKK